MSISQNLQEYMDSHKKSFSVSGDLIDASSILHWECSEEGIFSALSGGWPAVLGFSREEMIGKKYSSFQPFHSAELDQQLFNKALHEGMPSSEFKTVFLNRQKEQVHLLAVIRPAYNEEGAITGIEGAAQNITLLEQCRENNALNEARFQSLLEILNFPSESIQSFLDNALTHALLLTQSKIGYIYFYSETDQTFTLNSWSKNVMQQCSVMNPQTCYALSKTGIWGEAVRQRQAVMVNDFETSNPLKKGYPQGHVHLQRFLTIPVFNNNEIIAVVGVANKETDYGNTDILQLNLLMNTVWKVVDVRKAEDNLKTSEEKFRFTFELSPIGSVMVSPDQTIIDINLTFCEFLGYSKNELIGKKITEITHPDDIEASDTLISTFPHNEKHSIKLSKKYIRKDGSIAWGEVSVRPMVGSDGNIAFFIAVIQDISERKRYEDLLNEKELMFELFLEHSPIYIFFKDHEIRSFYLSRNYEKMLGRPMDQLLGKTMDDLFPSDIAKAMIEDDKKILREGKLVEVEEEFDGRYFNTIKFPIIQPDKPTMMAGFTIDITANKIAEKALKKAAEEWKTTFDATNDAMFLLDIDNKIIRANKTASVLFNTGIEIIIGQYCWKIVHNSETPHPDCPVLKTKQSLTREIMEFQNGTTWFQVTADPIIDENGQYNGCVHIISDITTRKESELEIKQNRDYIQAIFNSATEAFFIHDADSGNIIDVSQRMCRMYGYTYEEALKLSINDISRGTPPYSFSDAMTLFRKAMDDGPQTVEWLSKHKNGELFWTEISISAALISGKERIIATSRDIATRKKSEEIINRAQKMESLGVLAGGIAHDFNNLLSGIFGYLSLAAISADINDVRELINKALNVKNRAKGLTLQLLTFAKGGSPVKANGKLFPLVKETVEFALSGSNVIAEFSIPGNLYSCNFDRNQISQVFDNLTINAKQAMPLGGTLYIRAENADIKNGSRLLVTPGKFIHITVRDSGIGIPAEHLTKIFDPFFTTKQTGSGLGLATSYSIIRQHDGAIEAESIPGRESVFHVWLPADDRNGEIDDRKVTPRHKGSGRILLLDDDELILDLASRMLGSLGYTAEKTHTGEETLRILAQEEAAGSPFRAVILDLTIPGGMGGIETADRIRKINPDIKLFVATGYSDDPVMANPAKFGFQGSLAKPYLLSDLIELLNSSL